MQTNRYTQTGDIPREHQRPKRSSSFVFLCQACWEIVSLTPDSLLSNLAHVTDLVKWA